MVAAIGCGNYRFFLPDPMQKFRLWSVGLLALGLLGVYAIGLDIRRDVLSIQRQYIGEVMPFTLESALHYRRVKMMHDRGFLPEVDEAIQYPEGIRIREIDAVSSEPVQAFLASLFPESISFPERIRWIESGWFCLSIPLVVVFLRVWTGSWMAGWIAGLFYAVSLASVLRTTGQEISRENFAFPFIVSTYIFAARLLAAREHKDQWLFAILTGLFISLSLIAWDMSQFLLGVSIAGFSIHVLIKGRNLDLKVVILSTVTLTAILLTGIFHPYHRFHGLIFSPTVFWLAGILGAIWYFRTTAKDSILYRWIFPVLIVFLPMVVLGALGMRGVYGASYGHFAELLVAKIKFLNVKPVDPSLLSYYQRIMWVPSLHSATWGLTKWLFPATLWISGIVVIASWAVARKRLDSLFNHWVLLFIASVATYVFFVRFHVFVILSASVLAGWACGRLRQVGVGWQAPAVLLMLLGIMAEGTHTMRQKHMMGRPNVYYDELKELAVWLQDQVAPNPVLANMGVSAYIAAYGKCPIVIHPKFEDPSIRRRLFTYGDLLFGSDEKSFRDWMDDHGVAYYVYAKGEFSREQPELQMRYFVNRMDPPDDVPARRFERDDETMRYFTRLWGNHKYVVWKAMTREEESRANQYAGEALFNLEYGNLDMAEVMAWESLSIDRMQEQALQVLRHVGSLRGQGFRYQPVDSDP